MRFKRPTDQNLQSRLDRLRADIAAYRHDHKTKIFPPEIKARAVRILLENDLSQQQVARAIGISSPSLCRWLAQAEKPNAAPECRELVLIPNAPPSASWPEAKDCPQERIFLNLPNGLQFDLPLTALTAALVGDLMTARRG